MAALRLRRPSKARIPSLRAYVPDDQHLGLQPRHGMSLTFKSFLLAGAVPPYSDFLLDVLRYHKIRLAHLTPNSIVILSVFAHLCVKWLGVAPSVHLFRSYYHCRVSSGSNVVGSCFFRLSEKKSITDFIHIPWRGWFKGWNHEWLYVEDNGLEETALPTTRAVSRPSWIAPVPDTPELVSLRGRMAKLQRCGLTGAKVMLDAVKRRLAPLRKDMEIFPGEEARLLDQPHIRKCMVNLFGQKMARAVMATGDEEDDRKEGGEQEGDGGDEEDDGEEGDDEDGVPGSAAAQGDDEDDVPGSAGVQDDEDDLAGSAAAPHLVLPQSLEPTQVVGGKRPLSTSTDTAEVSRKAPRSVSTSSPAIATSVGLAGRVLSSSQPDPAPMLPLDHPESSQSDLTFNVGDAAHHRDQPDGAALEGLAMLLDNEAKRTNRLASELKKARHEAEGARQEAQRFNTENRRLTEELEKVRQEAQRFNTENRRLTEELEKVRQEAKRAETAAQKYLSYFRNHDHLQIRDVLHLLRPSAVPPNSGQGERGLPPNSGQGERGHHGGPA